MKLFEAVNPLLERIRHAGKKSWLIAGLSVFIIIVLAIVVFPESATIATVESTEGEFIIDLLTRGEIDALNSTSVSLPRMRRHMTYKIIDMAEEGSTVKKGDFLIQVDNAEALQNVDEAKDKLANSKAQLESEKATIASNMAQLVSQLQSERYSYQQAELSLKMMQFEAEAKKQEYELNKKKADVALKQAEEKIESQKIIDRATLMRAELDVRQAESELREAEKFLDALTLTAPIDGLVVYQEIFTSSGMKKVQVGDSPWPGMPIVGIPDLALMQSKTTVNEVDISKLEKGQNVIVTVDALEGKNYYGKISRVASLARRERSTNVKVFDVEVTLDSTDTQLRPGMTCECRIITGRIQNALSIPLQSVFQKDGKTVVYVQGGRKPKMREVTVGEKSSDTIVITSGLNPGERVCLRDPTIPLSEVGGESNTVAPKPKKKRQSSGPSGRMIIM
ncbi:hypothetical protein BVY01_04230 [bacterium I07]|nr:hypothetical protein BVY01_04230 [bacterium I07]